VLIALKCSPFNNGKAGEKKMLWQVQEVKRMDQKPMAAVHCSPLSSVPPTMSSQPSIWAAEDEKGG